MVLSVRALRYCHPGKTTPVFSDVSFTLGARQVLCLLGPNGVGKTTLLRCIAGLNPASAGQIILGADRAASQKEKAEEKAGEKTAQKMAYVPQSSHPGGLTALDMVLVGRTPHLSTFAMPAQADVDIARAMLERVGMVHVEDAPFHRLSGGERQLVVIARALAQEPALLIMDEPAASLDLGNQAKVLTLIRDVCRDGMAVLMTTHQPEHAWLLQADVAVLENGALTACGPAEEILDEARLAAMYGCPVEISRAGGKPCACTPRSLLA